MILKKVIDYCCFRGKVYFINPREMNQERIDRNCSIHTWAIADLPHIRQYN